MTCLHSHDSGNRGRHGCPPHLCHKPSSATARLLRAGLYVVNIVEVQQLEGLGGAGAGMGGDVSLRLPFATSRESR